MLGAWNRAEISITATAHPRIILLRSRFPNALGAIGYRFAPVVVGESEMMWGRKLTVAQFEPGWLDMTALVACLNEMEPGWGGSGTIIGSPIGKACGLSLETIVAYVIDLLLPQTNTQA